jgi:hypothetical protein
MAGCVRAGRSRAPWAASSHAGQRVRLLALRVLVDQLAGEHDVPAKGTSRWLTQRLRSRHAREDEVPDRVPDQHRDHLEGDHRHRLAHTIRCIAPDRLLPLDLRNSAALSRPLPQARRAGGDCHKRVTRFGRKRYIEFSLTGAFGRAKNRLNHRVRLRAGSRCCATDLYGLDLRSLSTPIDHACAAAASPHPAPATAASCERAARWR